MTSPSFPFQVHNMFKYVFDTSAPMDKRVTAVNNLVVLAREMSGAEMLLKSGVAKQINTLLKCETNEEIYLGEEDFVFVFYHLMYLIFVYCLLL